VISVLGPEPRSSPCRGGALRCCPVLIDGRSSWWPQGSRTASGQMTFRMTTRRVQDLKRSASQPLPPSGTEESSRRLVLPCQWEPRLARDNVDMIPPPHYSAAPSGDLCTTLKQSFVVQGESRRSVPITGERPQPFRPKRVALEAAAHAASAVSFEVSPLPVECSSLAMEFAVGSAGKCAVALVTGEQMKHGSIDDVRWQLHGAGGAMAAHASTHSAREQLVVEQARHGRRDGFPRNSFFT